MTFLCPKLITTSNILLKATPTITRELMKPKNCARYLGTSSYILPKRQQQQQRSVFTFAGPRNLNDILKLELIHDKSKTEVSDLWLTYHENKENVAGLIVDGKTVKEVLRRASKSPFFVQPVFRESGFFMLVSQFMSPTHFLFAYLEDYKMDPNRAQPLLTFSLFDDLCDDKNLGLVRADIVNKGISHFEGLQIVQNTINSYGKDGEYNLVKTFNSEPGMFDIEDYIAIQRRKWKMEGCVKSTNIDANDGN